MILSPPLHPDERLSGQRRNLQRRLAKWPILLGLAFSLASCVPPSTPDGNRPTPGHQDWDGKESKAYRSGHSDGSGDKRQHRAYQPRGSQFPPDLRDDYLRGYKDGYHNANDNPWSKHRAYELGQSYGRRDRFAGSSMDPVRHADEVPKAVRGDFAAGYREAWNSARPGTGVRPPLHPLPY